MKRYFFIVAVLILLAAVFVSCKVTPFAATDIAATVKTQVATDTNALQGLFINTGNITASVTVGSKQLVSMIVQNGNVDAGSLTAVHFYNLTAVQATDGGFTRGSEITPTSKVTEYDASANNQTTIRCVLDMSTAANFSDMIELYIDPTVLTANGGLKKLDLDGPFLNSNFGFNEYKQGEASDDALEFYITVNGAGTVATPVGATASDPRLMGWMAPPTLPTAIGATTMNMTYPYAAVDDTDYNASFAATFQLEKFGGTGWSKVAYSSAYVAATGVWTVTFPAATAAKEVYRWNILNPASLVTGKAVYGYKVKYYSADSLTSVMQPAVPIVDATPATYNLLATYGAVAVFDSAGYNGEIRLTVGSIGTEGLSGISAANLKIYDSANNRFVPVTGVAVTGAGNNIVIFTLNPSYKKSGSANNLQVQVGPSAMDLGATTATTDDVSLGDYTNATALPFGWDIVNLNASI